MASVIFEDAVAMPPFMYFKPVDKKKTNSKTEYCHLSCPICQVVVAADAVHFDCSC